MKYEDDEYEPSERSEGLIRTHWPDTLTPEHPLFQKRMFELQIALILGHMKGAMHSADRQRARRTIAVLRARIGAAA